MLLLLLAAALEPSATKATNARYMDVELVASSLAPRPGSTILIGFRMAPQPGWHGYWSNPGESGLAPTVGWTAPPGIRFGALLHPAPTLLQSMGLVSYVHTGPHVLVTRMTVGQGVRPGTPLTITADLNWAVCSKSQCVPQHARLSLQMVAGTGAPSPAAGALGRAVAALPRPSSPGSFLAKDGKLILELPTGLGVNAAAARFFPEANGYLNESRAQVARNSPPTIEAALNGAAPDTIAGVLSDGRSAYRLTFHHRETSDPPGTRRAAVSEPASAKAVGESPAGASMEPPPAAGPEPGRPYALARIIRALLLVGVTGFAVVVFALARRPDR